jgi:hypothetical protein
MIDIHVVGVISQIQQLRVEHAATGDNLILHQIVELMDEINPRSTGAILRRLSRESTGSPLE